MIATTAPSPWIGPAIVAASIAALVSIITVIVNGVLQRRDRQRQLMAEAYEKVQTYREFIYIVRRRPPDASDKALDERVRISNELSQVQARLNSFRALLKVEVPRVGGAYEELWRNTRRIAGGYIQSAWALPSTLGVGQMNVNDVDLSSLEALDVAYLGVVRAELALPPRSWILRPRAATAFQQVASKLREAPPSS